ncbi:hypothetical protein LCGC14_1793020 [marine sediment metagenome]|uniref:Uncharacterized protein n=1 Tax=marine sediment metagenome TaxID=412755 RepID=A0A0F9JRH7_9ZZZZ
MKTYEHNCIKISCGAEYSDTDPDPYYCSPCQEASKKIAEQIDAKNKGRTSEPVKSNLQIYDESPKAHGFVITKL